MKKWSFSYHFSKNTSNAPNVDRSRILLTPQQYFWGSIPQCNYFVCIWSNGNAESSGKTKIGNFDGSFVVKQQVLRFQISMNYSPRMTKNKPIKYLVKITLNITGKVLKFQIITHNKSKILLQASYPFSFLLELSRCTFLNPLKEIQKPNEVDFLEESHPSNYNNLVQNVI